MINNRKIISVMPAGRKKYLEILLPYIEKQRPFLDEHHFWLNTGNREDQAYIENVIANNPDFYKLIEIPSSRSGGLINGFWKFAAESQTIYVRFDDDLCWMSSNLVQNLVECRIQNPEPFAVYPVIFNNDMNYGLTYPIGLDSWADWWPNNMEYFMDIHRQFFEMHTNNSFPDIGISQVPYHRKLNINCLCWFGEDIQGKQIEDNEELDIAQTWPTKTMRPNLICGNAYVVHFAFGVQREYLQQSNQEEELLNKYKELSINL